MTAVTGPLGNIFLQPARRPDRTAVLVRPRRENTLDTDGSLSQVQSKKASETFRNYANTFNYNAAGAVTAMRLGNGLWETTQFNNRLQPTMIALGSGPATQNKLRLDYSYGTTANNGNVLSQTITVPGVTHPFVQIYTYDSLNRIKDATETQNSSQTWKQVFSYDRYGNRNFVTGTGQTTTLPPGCTVAICNPTVDPATNKLVGYVFDASGNTTTDAEGRTFVYDAENKQVKVKSGSTVIGEYFYDGDGKRIKKVVPNGETTIFVYDASGKQIAEYSTVVPTGTNAKLAYLTNDHLGSPRINTDATGQTISRHDYHPFGEEIARTGYGTDTIRKQFTGYERDIETELDFAQARMYAKQLARFTTPDPLMASAKAPLPESWNRYAYSYNNPLNAVDPSGLDVQVLNDEARKLLLDTLPENIRKKVEAAISKDGVIKQGALDKIVSKDKNFAALKAIVNDKQTTDVTTGTGFKNPGEAAQVFSYVPTAELRQKFIAEVVANGTSKEEAEKLATQVDQAGGFDEPEALFGVYQTAEQTGGNPRVTVSDATGPASKMSVEERVGTMGHELYGHRLLHLQNKPFGHGEKGGQPYSYFTGIENRSKANFNQQSVATPKAVKPRKK